MIERQPIPLDLSPTAEPGGVAVLGLGGWGSRAVGRLAAQGPASPLYVAVDSDAAALRRCPAPLKIQAGPKIAGGLGCGRPELGRLAFEDTWPELARLLAPAKIVFIVAGLGGGFGGGAAPAAAEALAGRPGPPTTIAAATLPPGRERRRRLAAERALAELI
ncbi:MAG: hypothetical protein LBU12_07290, partial [Deltaproteobacteria bacterium]|nr:hypothetical protein [Deltaproteobacteria bacterium]